MTGRRATAVLGVAIVAVAAIGGAALFVRERGPATDAPAAASAARDANAPSGGEPDVYIATVRRRVADGGGERVVETRVARRGDLRRHEWTEGEQRYATILRPDRGVVLLADLGKNVYLEQPLEATPAEGLTGEQVEALVGGSGAPFATRERVGEETIDGHPCVVYRSRIEGAAGAAVATVWEAKDLGGLAIRSETVDPDGVRTTTELVDLRPDPDPALFEPPAGASRVEQL